MDKTTTTNAWQNGRFVDDISYCLNRKRIFDALDMSGQAIWISGPAGAGKSWALASYLNAKNLNSLWYSLDKQDNEAVFFLKNFGQVIETFSQHSKQNFPCPPAELDKDNVDRFAQQFFEQVYATLTSPPILVLDNYQNENTQNGSAQSSLAKLLEIAVASLPQDGRLFILSRENIPDQ